jgi:hyperosmotically inducible protein
MKSKITFLTRPLLAPLFALAVIGLEMPASAADSYSRRPAADHAGAPLKASEVIGLKLENNEGQKVGSVEDLAIDLQAGRVVQLIVSTGGFLSMGERHSAVPPGRVHFREAGKPLLFDITREKLKSAPAFEMSDWKEFYQSDRVQESDRYYGEETAFKAIDAQGNLPAVVTSANGLGHVQRATKLMGLNVENLREENIGTVDNLIVDLSAGRVVAVIVSTGGFLGMGDTRSVVPPTALRFNSEHDRLRLDTTKEALSDAPRFKAGEWPDFAQRDYTAGVYRAYQQEAHLGREADNAARNTRDRGGRTLTPADQGGNESDVTLTQEIRKAVVATDGLSINAQNVKIITVKGRVTLRGPVRTAEEKAMIATIATRVAGAGNVDNQLEIAAR